MPLRNLIVLFLACIISLTCYVRADRNRYAASMAKAMNLVASNYLEDVEYRELYEHAMRGMTEALDPYSGYIAPDEFGHFQEVLDQEFGGIGILVEIDPDSERLMVMSPLIDTPAYRAGLKAGDTILSIDGHDTLGITLREAVELMRGRPGEPVRLVLKHATVEDPVEVLVVRAVIPVESVLGDHRRDTGDWVFQLQENPRIMYIRIVTFGERTVGELKETLRRNRPEALILDLRDNAGGLLTAAVDTCDLFIDEGTIVSTRGRGGQTFRTFDASSTAILDERIPMAVLVNGFSASASEIVAACLQDHGRAKVIGQRTWGKGTVQNVIMLEGGRAALRLTTASYLRPSGKNIHRAAEATEDQEWGIRPNEGFEVILSDEQADRVRRDRRRRDGLAPRRPAADAGAVDTDDPEFYDPPLEKAVEYLQRRLSPPAAGAVGPPASGGS